MFMRVIVVSGQKKKTKPTGNGNCDEKDEPRFLSVIMADEAIPRQIINEMLTQAWSKKFLDVTVLEWSAQHHFCDSQIRFHVYNPFLNQYYQDCYTPAMELFPDKLRDMHGYPFKVGIVHRPPNMNFITNSSGRVVQINGTGYGYLLILSEYTSSILQSISSVVDTSTGGLIANI
ncbi:hypothetical protein QAD02_010074 [Eretmocerus hayati]|uniref:Uncharacterized protein n=1 Tax=Eretmocerus hayati TaxID=131215 RepID=A0ACC2NCG2_9HYME|nr:hypothetical protein QAD02_010074 [Eretmocerus hayati]